MIALAAALALLAFAVPRGGPAVGWSLIGWLIMTLAGSLGGAWTVSQHGRPGSGFLVAVGICMLSRLVLGAAGVAAAAGAGTAAVWALLAGLAVTYVPLQVFEMIWFLRSIRAKAPTGSWT